MTKTGDLDLKAENERNIWPHSSRKAVFLLQAVMDVGPLLHEDWDGYELVSPGPLSLDGDVVASVSHLQRLSAYQLREVELLARRRGMPPFRTKKLFAAVDGGHGYGFRPDKEAPNPTEGELKQALPCVLAENELRASRVNRRRMTQRRIAEALRDGELTAVSRAIAGGEYSPPLPAHLWNTEMWEARFSRGQISLSAPFRVTASAGYRYIFVERKSLDLFMAGLEAKRNPTAVPMINAETAAIKFLSKHLELDPTMILARAEELCSHFGLSDRGLRYRVWPKAREMAGLPKFGRRGRPKNAG